MAEEPYIVIGIIDDRGAIDHRALRTGETDKQHSTFWPGKGHKLWRFHLTDWQLSKSPMSVGDITHAEALDIEARMRKYFKPPLWILEGDEWEAIGRPHSGPAYEKHCKRWERIRKRLTSRG